MKITATALALALTPAFAPALTMTLGVVMASALPTRMAAAAFQEIPESHQKPPPREEVRTPECK